MSLPAYVVCPRCGTVVSPKETELTFEKVQQVVENLDTGERTVYPGDEEVRAWLGELRSKYESVDVRVEERTEESQCTVVDPETGEEKTFRVRVTTRRHVAKCKPFVAVRESEDGGTAYKCPRCGTTLLVLRKGRY